MSNFDSSTSPSEPTFSRLDQAFAEFLSTKTQLPPEKKAPFKTLIAQLSYEQRQGHNCLLITPEQQTLILASGLASHLTIPHSQAEAASIQPLVLEENRLYLHRYWQYESRLAQQLKQKLPIEYHINSLDATLDHYFPATTEQPDWQRAAAKLALTRAFALITGGPGTGKTTTVLKILALMQSLAEKPLHIALAAPTGKAAMRLQESIGFHLAALPCEAQIKKSLPQAVTTIHRLLGARPPSPYFSHDASKPLPHDLVVVDEASMIDLALMSKLVDALKPDARLILLGDKEQLASVEAGAVLADLHSALPTHTVELKTAHRFSGEIKALAEAINSQAAASAWAVLNTPDTTVSLLSAALIPYIAAQQQAYLKLIKQGKDFKTVLTAFMRFQVLCATRQGPNSVADINYQVEQQLAQQHLISLSGLWYSGRPIMITQNNPTLHLYNGDIGLCLPDPDKTQGLKVFFQRPDGSVKSFLPARISHCETVYAMTIHKSQGSEFEEVLVLLPEQLNPGLTKELLYTAITRAKQCVKVASTQAIFNATISQKVTRVTGLIPKLQCED